MKSERRDWAYLYYGDTNSLSTSLLKPDFIPFSCHSFVVLDSFSNSLRRGQNVWFGLELDEEDSARCLVNIPTCYGTNQVGEYVAGDKKVRLPCHGSVKCFVQIYFTY